MPLYDIKKNYQWRLRAELMVPGTLIQDLQETRALFDLIAQIPEFAVHRPSASDPSDHLDVVLNFFATNIIAEFVNFHVLDTSGWAFDAETFDNLYSDLEQFLYRFAEIPIRTTIELWHVKSEISPIPLSTDVTIRSLTEKERIESKVLTSSAPGTDPFDENPPVPEILIEINQRGRDFLVDGGYKMSRLYIGSHKAVEIAEQVLLALRLINQRPVWLGFRQTRPANRFLATEAPQDLANRSVWRNYPADSLWDGSPAPAPHPPFAIDPHVADKLMSLWPVLAPSLKHKKLGLPLRRFRFSYDRTAVTDRLIDHWIALEALFAENEQEIAYKVSQRIAQFIGKSPQERWDIFSAANKSYNIRSRIVHGDEFKHEDLLKHSVSTEDYLRRSLRKCLEDQLLPNRKQLEKQIFLQDPTSAAE
jgi:hypothetical protein